MSQRLVDVKDGALSDLSNTQATDTNGLKLEYRDDAHKNDKKAKKRTSLNMPVGFNWVEQDLPEAFAAQKVRADQAWMTTPVFSWLRPSSLRWLALGNMTSER